MSDLINELFSLDNAIYNHKDRFRAKANEYLNHIKNQITHSGSEQYWSYIDSIKQSIEKYGKDTGIIKALETIFRNGDLIEVVTQFEFNIQQVAKKQNIWEQLDCSDDSWTDFCDSVQLEGKAFFQNVLNGHLKTNYNINELYLRQKMVKFLHKRLCHIIAEKHMIDYTEYNTDINTLLEKENIQLKHKIQELQNKISRISKIIN